MKLRVHLQCKNLHQYLRELCPEILDRLYNHPATCLAVYRYFGTKTLALRFCYNIEHTHFEDCAVWFKIVQFSKGSSPLWLRTSSCECCSWISLSPRQHWHCGLKRKVKSKTFFTLLDVYSCFWVQCCLVYFNLCVYWASVQYICNHMNAIILYFDEL